MFEHLSYGLWRVLWLIFLIADALLRGLGIDSSFLSNPSGQQQIPTLHIDSMLVECMMCHSPRHGFEVNHELVDIEVCAPSIALP